jgi:hypothetical protein
MVRTKLLVLWLRLPLFLVRKQLDAGVGLAEAAETATVVVVGLTPRYVAGLCSDSPTHVENFGKDDFGGRHHGHT